MDEEMIARMRDAILEAMDITDGLDVEAAEAYARAAHSVIAGQIAELEGALRDLRENIGPASLVRNPTGKRVRDRADAALAQHKGTDR